ncbi:hypothetical protein [Anaerosolibacter sp.]|uniref:hypothetical protein n=1 Tax=Anaerosolibacter sp. TaxID=1872527 RepID=UPI0039F01ADC
MIKLHCIQKLEKEGSEFQITLSPIATDGTIVNGTLTILTIADAFQAGKGYDLNLAEII